MTTKKLVCVLTLTFALSVTAFGQTAKHKLTLDDVFKFREVRDPQLSPDGQTVAYVVSTTDMKEDKSTSHVYAIGYDGQNARQMTSSPESESSPRWSPDGRYLAFTSSRPGPAKGNQVWLLDRRGGEAMQLTEIKGGLQGYEWSPDSKRLAMVVGDPDPDADATGAPPKTPKPIVIDRYKYKQDGQGYLLSNRHSYVYLFDIAAKKLERLTNGKFDESSPAWSPDGTTIAFTSNHNSDPDREPTNQIFIADAKPNSTEKAITPTTVRANRGKPEWSPDGKWIAFLESDEKKWGAYNMDHASIVQTDGMAAPSRVRATEALDRGVTTVKFSADGKYLTFIVTDDQSAYPSRSLVDGTVVEKMLKPPVIVSSWMTASGHSIVMSGGDMKYNEVYAFTGAALSPITHENDAMISALDLGATEEVAFKSKDGTEVHGLLTKPVGYVAGTKVPTLLRIHGGPNGQDGHSFSTERQFFAANGYAVLAINYRGSSGRGQKFSRAIFADWGHFEVDDLLAGVDHVIKMGVADPDRLGVGGWSYGGILTDYLIATDKRFKAATSGAGTAFTVAFYGTDQYIIQYDFEIGPPWDPKAWETYQRISYPFLHADRIKTPTLFLGGERDFNVPVQGGQQMYQALRSLNVDTQLIIYPNETHGISRPSYVKDRYERYLAWYEKYIPKPATTAAAGKRQGRGEETRGTVS